ncbi:MAG: acyl-CoA thioesterase [Phycisphaerales bacterium]
MTPLSSHEPPKPTRPAADRGSTRLRIRYSECDPMGVAHHAAYAPWLEIARTELLRDTGVTYADLERAGVFLVITRLECRYRRPLFYDDLIEVRTRVLGGSKVKIEHDYEIVVINDGGHGGKRPDRTPGEIVTTAATTLVCVGGDGKVRPLPDWLAPKTPGS